MRNEKIFNAMEHLEDKFIAEAIEEYGSAEDIDLEAEDPIDPYAEGIEFKAENGGVKRSGRFIKWAGLAAGLCAVTAGVSIMGSSGFFDSIPAMPFGSFSSESTEALVTTAEPAKAVPKIYGISKLKESFDLEELGIISDSNILEQMKSGNIIAEGDKIYFVQELYDEQKVTVCTYDLKEKTTETVLEVKARRTRSRDLTLICVYGGCLYYRDYEENYYYDDLYDSTYRTCICKYDIDTKTSQEIFSVPIAYTPSGGGAIRDRTGEQYLGKVKAAGKYLFFENGVFINADYETSDNISRYDMESGETVVFKENAGIFDTQEDRLLLCCDDRSNGVWKLSSCGLESGENEEGLWVFPYEFDYDDVCVIGNDVWSVKPFTSADCPDPDRNTFGFEIRCLDESKELETVATIYELAARKIKEVHGLIVSDRIILDSKSGECIITSNHALLYVIGGELYCFDSSGLGTGTEVYRFNIEFHENGGEVHPEEIKYPEYGIEELKEKFDIEELEITDDILKQELINYTAAAIQGNKIYFINNLVDEYITRICAYDTENKTTEVVYEKEYNNLLRFACPLLVYENSLYYQNFIIKDSNDGEERVFYLCRLDLSTGQSKMIYKLNCIPATLRSCLTVKASGKYLFFEDLASSTESSTVVTAIRYDIESGESEIFKENAAMPTPNKDKLYFYRSIGDTAGALYRCDIESGENEEKLLDMFLFDTYDLMCSDGEKIWTTPTYFESFGSPYAVAYLDEKNKAVSVYYSNSYRLKNIVYANGYILLEKMLINTKSNEIFKVKGRAIALNGQLFYTESSNEEESETKIYRLNAKP